MKALFTHFRLQIAFHFKRKWIGLLTIIFFFIQADCISSNVLSCPGSLQLSQNNACVGECITVSYNGIPSAGATYIWTNSCGSISGGNSATPHIACFTTPGICTLQLTIQKPGLPSEVCDVSIEVFPKPNASFGEDISICAGSCTDLHITATGPAPYTVTIFDGINTLNASFGSSTFELQVCPSLTTTYTLTSIIAGPCDTVNLNNSIIVNVNPGPNAFISQNGNSLIAYPDNSNYDWYTCNGDTLHYYLQSLSPADSGCYCCIVTDPISGCKDTVCANFIKSCDVSCLIDFKDTICVGDMVTFSYIGNASPNADYNWTIDLPGLPGVHFTGLGPISLQYNDTSCYHISLTVTENNCTSYCTGLLCVKLQNWTPHIFQQGATLLAFPNDTNFSYSWHKCNDTTVLSTQQAFTPDTTGCYCVIFTDKCGCKDTSCIDFPILCNLSCDFIGADSICVGDSITLTYTGNGSPNATYNWLIDLPGNPGLHFIGAGPKVITYHVPGCYHVSLTVMENNCLAICQDSFCVKTRDWNAHFVEQNGTLFALPNNPGSTFVWTHCNDTSVLSTQQTYTPAVSGCFCCVITDKCGCRDTVCSDITIPCNLLCSLSGADSICVGDSVTLSYTGNGSTNAIYNWLIDLPGFPDQHFIGIGPKVIHYDTPGCYHVSLTVTEANCTTTCQDSFCVSPTPTAELCCDESKCGLCHDLNISFTGTPPWYLQLNDGSSTTSLGPINTNPFIYTVCPTDTTTYTLVQITDAGNLCQGNVYGSATINVLPHPTASISISGDTLCASPSNQFYGWWTCNGSPYFSTEQCVVVNQPGCYCVTVSTNLDCVDSACIMITKTHDIQVSDKIWIYPIPASEEINIKLLMNNTEPERFEIIDMNGRIIKQIIEPIISNINSYRVNVGDLTPGMHLIKTYTRNNVFISKFLKQ